MADITRQDLRRAARFLAAIGAASTDAAGFARAGVALLPELVASDLTTLSDCDLSDGRREVVAHPGSALSAEDIACFDRFFHEHPLVRFHGRNLAGGTRRVSDIVAPSRFRKSPLFNEYYRRIGIQHVVAVPLRLDGKRIVSFVLNRSSRDFSDRDRELLDLVRGGLAALYENACAAATSAEGVAALRALAEEDGWSAVTLDRERKVVRLPGRAAKLLAAAFPRQPPGEGAALPAALDTLVASHTGSAPRAATLLFAQPLRVLVQPLTEGGWLLWVREDRGAAAPVALVTLPLTAREREVLSWVAAGKSNAQIAEILGASPRTVQKHLERIYEKLGVESRTAAAMRAVAAGTGAR